MVVTPAGITAMFFVFMYVITERPKALPFVTKRYNSEITLAFRLLELPIPLNLIFLLILNFP